MIRGQRDGGKGVHIHLYYIRTIVAVSTRTLRWSRCQLGQSFIGSNSLSAPTIADL